MAKKTEKDSSLNKKESKENISSIDIEKPTLHSALKNLSDQKTKNPELYKELFESTNLHELSHGLEGGYKIPLTLSSIFDSQKTINHFLNDDRIKVDEEIIDLRKRLNEAIKNQQVTQDLYKELSEKEKNAHIIKRIHDGAIKKYLNDQEFRNHFTHKKESNSVVISIDIRRSTDLMLKARKPEMYSDFITELSRKLAEIIIENFGIFDKFTGDGILAFFPDFYSGEDSILYAIKAAQLCHEEFLKHYHQNKNLFSVFIKDIGLGIGIDYGQVTIVNTGAELTVVGKPVVYACRFGGANAGETLLNIEANEKLVSKMPSPLIIDIIESEIYIKNEGKALAYQPLTNLKSDFAFTIPTWLDE